MHTHRFKKMFGERVDKKILIFWRCLTPDYDNTDCSYCVHQKQQDFLLKHESLCWKCGRAFQFSEINFCQIEPTCSDCYVKNLIEGGPQ